MAIGDLYELVQFYTTQGEKATSRFWYVQTSTLGDSESLHTAYSDLLWAAINNVQSQDTFMYAEEVVNTNDPGDFFKNSYSPQGGARPSDAISSFNSLGFIYHSSDRRIRSGGKRIPGPPDDDFVSGFPIPAYDALLSILATGFVVQLFDSTRTYDPRLFTPGNVATGGLPLIVDLAAVTFARLSTQSSRKGF